ncbi:hypothetical protein M8C21_023622 [Ambrosia artemisiifolia]|uniref:Uncharacterized protein n=1 Tax=Ambrosia artemisiifolia TaxID=4212 RepID=A0AAD5CXJ6_AMBAR|nr:hypothetical protein M8C21_023622 [Ambrosia artemisiifolia]
MKPHPSSPPNFTLTTVIFQHKTRTIRLQLNKWTPSPISRSKNDGRWCYPVSLRFCEDVDGVFDLTRASSKHSDGNAATSGLYGFGEVNYRPHQLRLISGFLFFHGLRMLLGITLGMGALMVVITDDNSVGQQRRWLRNKPSRGGHLSRFHESLPYLDTLIAWGVRAPSPLNLTSILRFIPENPTHIPYPCHQQRYVTAQRPLPGRGA